MLGGGPLNKYFCKTFVKITATRAGVYKTLCPQLLAPNSK